MQHIIARVSFSRLLFNIHVLPLTIHESGIIFAYESLSHVPLYVGRGICY